MVPFFGIAMGEGAAGVFAGFPPKAIRQINNDMNENVCPEKAKLPQWLRNHCKCPNLYDKEAA